MDSNTVVPITTIEGHQYLIEFSIVSDVLDLPKSIQIGIANVAIVLVDGAGINNASTLYAMASVLKEYLESNDVVLYCYCDNKEIPRSKPRQNLSPQHYRSMLFNKMFERQNNEEYLNRSFVVKDVENGDHYINLISRSTNIKQVDIIEENLLKMEKP